MERFWRRQKAEWFRPRRRWTNVAAEHVVGTSRVPHASVLSRKVCNMPIRGGINFVWQHHGLQTCTPKTLMNFEGGHGRARVLRVRGHLQVPRVFEQCCKSTPVKRVRRLVDLLGPSRMKNKDPNRNRQRFSKACRSGLFQIALDNEMFNICPAHHEPLSFLKIYRPHLRLYLPTISDDVHKNVEIFGGIRDACGDV